jgi:hypothetical protein
VSNVEGLAAALPHLAALRVVRVFGRGAGVRIEAVTTAIEATCPGCGFASRRVHSLSAAVS